ncbi:MAG: BMC domain-containing protein [Deltaproteobacteria bacterium]|nr:MAG: BMC domain-containing protein [Deltaproteobacteria bacterium]
MRPALGMIELSSIALGYVVCDALLKRAPVELSRVEIVEPGKILLLFHGDEASVEESLHAALAAGGEQILDFLYIPNLHPQIPGALTGNPLPEWDAVGIVESTTVVAAIVGADRALKAAAVNLLRLRITGGLGGKGVFTLAGPLEDVEAAVAAALEEIAPRGALVRKEIIPAPHEDLWPFFA